MWVPNQLDSEEHRETLKRLGLEIDPSALANPLAHPLGAVVHLGNCSASFVSDAGLVATNHHCVTSALQYSSTPDENLLKQGFVATTRNQERWNGPGSRVYVTQKLTDVTDRVRRGLEAVSNDRERYLLVETRQKQLLAECEAGRPELRCQVAAYDGGARYILIERLQIKDVRLVYAPPESIGRYGGEIDNWMWPRHSGDFALYRAYVGPDGTPAEHAANNVPYRPEHHLRLPSEPLSEGDLVFVAGYPGRTYRNHTAMETDEVVTWRYPRTVQLAEAYLAALDRAAQDPKAALRSAPLRRGLENALKYTQGALETMAPSGVAEARQARDASLRANDPALFAQLEAAFAAQRATREFDAAVGELRLTKLLPALARIVRTAQERPKPDAERKPGYQERDRVRQEASQKRLDRTYHRDNDIEVLVTAVSRMAGLTAPRPQLVKALLGPTEPTPDAVRAALRTAFATTQLEDTAARVQLLNTASIDDLQQSEDPLMRLAIAYRKDLDALEARTEAFDGTMLLLRPQYLALLDKLSPGVVAPDANNTLRVTYGTVQSYEKQPGAGLTPSFTVLSGVVQKATGAPPFDAPPSLLSAAPTASTSPYVDAKLGDVPVNFISNLDITGGNSGSATFNRKGEIVGLAFDGNYESMASDWLYLPEVTRTIHVDIRYMLWVMNTLDGADVLVREMEGSPALMKSTTTSRR